MSTQRGEARLGKVKRGNPPEPESAGAADRQWLDDHGIPFTEDGIRRAGALILQKRERMTPEAWAALRDGPGAYAAYLADQDCTGQ